MHSEELKLPKDIELKFHRLGPPSLNSLCLPLSGLYHPLDNEQSSEYLLKNHFKNYDLSPNNFVNIENLFSVNSNFGKLLVNETLQGLLIFINKSENEITIKNLKMKMRIDDYRCRVDQPLEVEIPNTPIVIPPKKSYTIKVKAPINFVAKHRIDIYFNTLSPAYDQLYYKIKQRTIVKENTEYYTVTNGSVEFIMVKMLSFESINPLKINEFFHNSQVNKCFIEVRISNAISYPLTILDIYLTPKNKKNDKIPLVKSLEQIKNNNNRNKNKNDSKYIVLQSEEQIRILFKVDNTDFLYDVKKLQLNIVWLNHFDFTEKLYIYEFSNNLNTYNDYYKISVTEKPEDDIILNQNFKIIINLQSKNLSKKYSISLSQEPLKDDDISTDREIEIIDIIEKKMELNAKTPSNNFVLICKSDILGNVYLPKLKFSIYEGDKNIPIENIYESLLTFNCISKI